MVLKSFGNRQRYNAVTPLDWCWNLNGQAAIYTFNNDSYYFPKSFNRNRFNQELFIKQMKSIFYKVELGL